jgi:hypothetical protein
VGNKVENISLDGNHLSDNFIPATLTGFHEIEIVMGKEYNTNNIINTQNVLFAPPTPIEIKDIASDKCKLIVYKNGHHSTEETDINSSEIIEIIYAVRNTDGLESFGNRPKIHYPKGTLHIIEAEQNTNNTKHNAKGFTGSGYILTSKDHDPDIWFEITLPEEGVYAIDFRYSNGTGPVNTDNNCAIRTLYSNGNELGAIVFPQPGKDEWSKWCYTNYVNAYLPKGRSTLKLLLKPYNENMDGAINTALIDHIRLVKLPNYVAN